jgi:hypothetical protein
MFNLGILLVYTQNIHVMYTAYAIYMLSTWYMHGICNACTQNILVIYMAYAMIISVPKMYISAGQVIDLVHTSEHCCTNRACTSSTAVLAVLHATLLSGPQ